MTAARRGRRLAARRCLGAAAGIALDRALGEPPVPDALHPVALLGRGIAALEGRVYDDRRAPGAVLAAAALGGAAIAGGVLRSPAAATYVAASGRALHDAAGAVGDALVDGDLDRARERLTHLVGRDPSSLDAAEISRAVVESVAENTTDAVVAPAMWAAVAGAPGAFAHRAADTLDSMVGYRDARYRHFGTVPARVDDALAWVPARVTAGLVAAVRPRRARAVVAAVRGDARLHPSPNAGVAEAAFAAALGLRLGGGENRYGTVVERRPSLGDGRAPAPSDIAAAVALSRQVSWALAAGLTALGTGLLWWSVGPDGAVPPGSPVPPGVPVAPAGAVEPVFARTRGRTGRRAIEVSEDDGDVS